jgi:hypothetical protein
MGNNSSITKNSWFMIHNVSGGVWGDVDTVENYASTLRKFNNRSRDFYAEATSMRKEDVTKMMNSETWLTAQEAVDKGFIKNITGAQNFTQKIQKDNWQFANMAVLNSYNADVLPAPSETDSSITTQLDNMKKFFQDLGTEIMNAIKGVKAPENNDHGALMASIGEAVSQTFIAQSEPMEKAVNDAVTAGNKIDFTSEAAQAAINAAVKVAVDAVTNDLSGKITALETTNEGLVAKNEELEKDIIKIKGNKSQPDKNEIVDKVYGKFN